VATLGLAGAGRTGWRGLQPAGNLRKWGGVGARNENARASKEEIAMVSRMVHSRRSWILWIWIAFGAGALILCWNLALGSAADSPKSTGGKTAPAASAIGPDLQKILDEHGLKIAGNNLTIAGEGDLAKGLTDAPKLKKALIAAERDLHAVEAEVEELNTQIAALKVQHVELSAGLTRAAGTTENNRFVGALNATSGQIDLLMDKHKEASKGLKDALSKASDAREAYVELTLNMRTMAEEISGKWSKLAEDDEVKEAVEKINSATGKKLKLVPSPGFVTAEKRLQALEHTVLSESIPMKTDDSGMQVTVVIDGKHKCEMEVDSGATSMTLPYKMAKDFGLEPKSSDPKIICVLADGSKVPATITRLSSVRVGKFTVEDVECAVFDPKAVNASALLGMSFLGNFKFEIDKQKSELRMVKVDSGDSPKGKAGAKGKKPAGKPPAGKSKKPSDDEEMSDQ
jgi:aspartyl protease family protein